MKKISITDLINELKKKLKDDLNETQIIEIRNTFIKKYLNPIYDELKLAPVSEKKELGNTANLLKKNIFETTDLVIEKIQQEQENKSNDINYDISISPADFSLGSVTPFSLIIDEAMAYFKSLNFKIVDGSEIVETRYNFDHLNININHPARSYRDSFFINSLTMLRTHCTALTAQLIDNNQDDDIRLVTFGNVYRNDEDDATHSHQFNQIDIV
jgi:phenylalanyl-tRNA synthetase alpha chain